MMPLLIREIADAAGWRSLEPHWDALLHRSRVDCLFLTWDWMDSWLEVYGDGGEWMILVAEDAEGRIIGIAPMMIDLFGTRLPARWIRRLTLLGQKADTSSEYLDWIILAGREEEVARAFCMHLFTRAATRWDVLEFGIMRADSPVLPVFRAMFAGAWQEESLPSAPFIELPRTWADFLAEHSANYRQRLGRFHRKHQTRLLIAGEQITVAEALKVIRDLNLGRWAGQGSSFKSERYERFHALIAKRLEAKQRLLLVLLEADGVIVAGRYDFVYAGKGWNFQGGWRPDWEKQSVGKMVLAEVVRLCIERGLREYDLLAGKSGYKDELATGGHEILRAQAWRPGSWKGRCWQELRALRFRVSSK